MSFRCFPFLTAGPLLPPREQVALLSRSVRIVGRADTPGLGCHTIAMEGFAGGRQAWVAAWLRRQIVAVPRIPATVQQGCLQPAVHALPVAAPIPLDFKPTSRCLCFCPQSMQHIMWRVWNMPTVVSMTR